MPRRKSVKRCVGLLSSAAAVALASAALQANTEYDVINGQTDLTSASTYTVGGQPASSPPSASSDVTFDSGFSYNPTAFTINTSLTIGTLDDLDSTDSLSISNTGSAAATLTLSGGTNSVAPSLSDLLYVASGGTLTITGGSGSTALGLALASAGNLDIAGTASISSIITGSNGFTLTGGGMLNLGGANTFTGTVAINSGTLQLGSTTALGAAANAVTVASGGTLDINGNTITAHTGTITINGAGPNGTGAALINSGPGTNNPAVENVTLGSNSTFSSGPNRFDIDGALNAAGFTFTKIGTGYTAMKGTTSNLTVLNINQGSWEVSNATGLGTNATTTVDTIASGATVDFYDAPTTAYVTTIDLNGGQFYVNGSTGTVNVNGSIVLGSGTTSTVNANSGPIALGGVISGGGNLTTVNSVTISGNNTYTGNTNVSGGTTTISNTSGSGTGTGNVNVSANATLNVSGTVAGNVTLASNATLNVSGGTVGGNVTVASSATLQLSGTVGGNVVLGNTSTLTTGATGTIDGNLSGPSTGNNTLIEPGGVYSSTHTFGTLNVGSLAASYETTLNFDLSTPTSSDTINVTQADGFTATGSTPLTFGAVPAAAGTFNLIAFNIDANGSAPPTGDFDINLTLSPRLSYTLQETAGTPNGSITPYDLQLIVTGGAPTTTTFIGTNGSSASPADWTDSTQWLNGVVGGLQGDTVNFNNGDSSAGTVYVNLNGQQHVGTLNFDNTGTDSFSIGQGSATGVTPALYLDNGSSTATINNSVNNNTITAPVVLFSNSTMTAASGTVLTISGNISGSSTLTIPASNAGTIVLSGANTNSGGISLTGGLLAVNSAGALGTGTFTLNSGATFDNTSGAAITLSTNPPQKWAGSFTFVGTQSLNMGTGTVTLSVSPTITVNANTLTMGGGITGAFGITKAGSGTLLISSSGTANTFTGATVINGGTLELTGSNNGSQGALAATPSITINAGAELLVIGSSNDTLGYYSGRDALIINDGSVMNDGTKRRMTIQNAVNMTGGTLGGTSAGDGDGLYSFDVNGTDVIATSDASGNPATIPVTIGIQTPSTLNVTRGTSANLTAASPDLVISGSLIKYGSTEAITKTGTGIAVLSGANTFTGATTVSAGTLRLNGTNTGTSGATVAAGAILGGSGSIAGTTTVNGTITAGPDALTSGTFTTAAQTWPNSGNYLFKLASDPSGSYAGTPSSGGTSTTWDEIKFTTLSVTASTSTPFTVTLDYIGSSSFDPTTGFTIPIAYSTGSNAINSGTAYTPAAITLASMGNTLPPGTSASNYSVVENPDNSEIDLVYTPAPEPSSLGLLGLAAAGALVRRRRRHST